LDGLRLAQPALSGVADVRGLGLMVAAEFTRPDGVPDSERADAVVARCVERHKVILMTCGTFSNVVRFMPALVVDEQQIDRCLGAFTDAVAATG
jgi:4-aminobutyrate aminotransferase